METIMSPEMRPSPYVRPADVHPSNAALRHAPRALVCVLAAFLLTACAGVPPPTEQVAVSRAAVADAVSAGGGEYAPAALRRAQEMLDRSNAAMVSHQYADARRYAEDAEVDARLAAVTARSEKARKAVSEIEMSIQALKEELARATTTR
jgi:hypothetical protein